MEAAIRGSTTSQPEADLKRVAASYVDELTRRGDEIEQARQLPKDIAERMARDGLYKVCTPVEYGGSGFSPRTYAEIVETLAQGDASAAWCTFIAITSSFSIASAQTEAVKSLLHQPDIIASGVFAPNGRAIHTVQGGVEGYLVTGQWQWGSGSRNAHLISGGAFLADEAGQIIPDENGKPQHRLIVFKANELTLLDTWNVMGMSGSGSTDYRADGVFIPAERAIKAFGGVRAAHPIFLFPNFGMLAIGIGAVALGAANAAIADFLSFAGQKVPQGNSRVLAQKSSTQFGVAKAEATLRAARAFFYEAIDAAWEGAQRGDMTVEHRRDIRLATSHAASAAKTSLDIIYELAGGTAVYLKSPIQRRFRDVRVAGQHMMVSPATFELVGRLTLGLPTNIDQL